MPHLLETKHLSLSIAKKIKYQNIHWQIQPGEQWGILGANGSGKTTLLLTLAGIIPAVGDIFLLGKNLTDINRKWTARQLGILFQEIPRDPFPQTVFEYCSSGRYPHLTGFCFETQYDRKIILHALTDMDLAHCASQKIQTLSGGEFRRLNIATLLAQNPQIYLLDEPLNHLDLKYQIKVLEHFKKLTQKKAVSTLMTLHNISIAQKYCDKILLLFGDGEWIVGTPTEILTVEHLQKAYGCVINNEYWQG